jgi:hypothetical protein
MGGTFSTWSVPRCYKQDQLAPRVQAGSNTSTVALRVVGRDEKGTQCLGYNWATLFLEDINMGTWPSTLEESRIWDSKIWSWIQRDLDSRLTLKTRTSGKCKRQTCPLVREGAPHQQTRNCLTVITNLVLCPRWVLDTKTDWSTDRWP